MMKHTIVLNSTDINEQVENLNEANQFSENFFSSIVDVPYFDEEVLQALDMLGAEESVQSLTKNSSVVKERPPGEDPYTIAMNSVALSQFDNIHLPKLNSNELIPLSKFKFFYVQDLTPVLDNRNVILGFRISNGIPVGNFYSPVIGEEKFQTVATLDEVRNCDFYRLKFDRETKLKSNFEKSTLCYQGDALVYKPRHGQAVPITKFSTIQPFYFSEADLDRQNISYYSLKASGEADVLVKGIDLAQLRRNEMNTWNYAHHQSLSSDQLMIDQQSNYLDSNVYKNTSLTSLFFKKPTLKPQGTPLAAYVSQRIRNFN